MKTLSIDIETYSGVDLAKCGVYKYAESDDFEVLLFGYAADGGEVHVVDLANGEKIPDEIIDSLTNDSVVKWAYNANFERVCLSRYLSDAGVYLDPFHDRHPLSAECARYLNPESWRCSMVWAAYMGLPLSLEGSGAVLGLEKQKLTEGKELIRFFCKPCAPTKSNGGRTRNLPSDAPDKWDVFKQYNRRDVEVEMSIQRKLSKFPVPDEVWTQYRIDQEINDRGVAVDMELVHQAISMDTYSRQKLTAAMKELTDLDNPNSVQQMKQWLSDNGLDAPSLGKKEVALMLKTAPCELQSILLLVSNLRNHRSKNIRQWKTPYAPTAEREECFSSTVQTGQDAGREDSFNCRICRKIISRIYPKRERWFVPATTMRLRCSTAMCRIRFRSLSEPHSFRRKTASSSYPTFPPSKPVCLHGLPEKNGGRMFLKTAEISTVLRQVRCSKSPSKNTASTDICGRRAKSRSWRSDTADPSVL
nr:MAG TPA: DNA polymerase I [Caudoviricetes sp.]